MVEKVFISPNRVISIPKWSDFNFKDAYNAVAEWVFQSQNGLILTMYR